MKIASIGIDIGKTTFHLVAVDEHGSIVVRRKFSRKALLAYSAKLTTSLIGMEACGGAHCLARLLRDQGHQVRLIPGQFVKRYREANKNDYLDAGSDSRSRHPQELALRSHQDRGPAGSTGAAPGTRTTGWAELAGCWSHW